MFLKYAHYHTIAVFCLIACIIAGIGIAGFIKLKYGFWALQPVFHVYDIRYLIGLSPMGVIRPERPAHNKYTNFANITTTPYTALSSAVVCDVVEFIRANYLQNGSNRYVPKAKNIIPYLADTSSPSIVSVYYASSKIKKHDGRVDSVPKIVGVITSRPVSVVMFDRGNSKKEPTTLGVQYVDYLCVDKSRRKTGIAPQLIQTHYYNQRHGVEFSNDASTTVCLFKREGELTGIVPLCVYSSYGFLASKWGIPSKTLLPGTHSVVEVTSQNFYLTYDFIVSQKSTFLVAAFTDASNLLGLIKTGNIFIRTIVSGGTVLGVVVFKKSCTFMADGVESLSCVASIRSPDLSESLFVGGFKLAFWQVAKQHRFEFLDIEDISHNKCILLELLKKNKPVVVSPTAYFFYNYAAATVPSSSVCVMF